MAEIKCALLFETTVCVHEGDSGEWLLRTYSPPLVLIVHVSQEAKARGTIFWDNALSLWTGPDPSFTAQTDPLSFSWVGREPFKLPESVRWGHLKRELSGHFNATTGRGLTEGNLRNLAQKLGIY